MEEQINKQIEILKKVIAQKGSKEQVKLEQLKLNEMLEKYQEQMAELIEVSTRYVGDIEQDRE